MQCPKCNIQMVEFCSKHSAKTVQSHYFCPRCRDDITTDIVEGALEVEEEFFVIVHIDVDISINQIKSLRAADATLRDISIRAFINKIKQNNKLTLGPFWPKHDAEKVLYILQDAGIEADIQ